MQRTVIDPASLLRPPRPRPRLAERLIRLGGSAWFAYAVILIIQFRRIWGVWVWRDLAGGDTANYFLDAWRFYRDGQTDIAWSPLYTIFYGSLLHTGAGAAAVTMLHRVLIVLAASVLVLAVARRMLPPFAAWFVALWWVALPVDFDPLYEVHLFALLPVLLAWWVIMGPSSAWRRGTGFALLVMTTLLVRNEMIVGVLLLAPVLFWWETSNRPPIANRKSQIENLLTYFLPLLAISSLTLAIYLRTPMSNAGLLDFWHTKHTMNMGQAYAFGYKQRRPNWPGDPWTDFGPLCRQTFGSSRPSLALMLRQNPAALASHVAWNFRLLPAGLQVLLFNATSDYMDPDYAPVPMQRRYPNALSLVVLAICITGAALMWRRSNHWMRNWARSRALGWLSMLAVAAVAAPIIATQRPRPEYLYFLSVFLMILIVTCGLAIVPHRLLLAEGVRRWAPLAMVVPIAFARSAYGTAGHHARRPLMQEYQRLLPYQPLIADRGAILLSEHAFEISLYLGYGLPAGLHDYAVFDELRPNRSLARVLADRHVNLLALNDRGRTLLDSEHPGKWDEFVAHAGASGWRLIGLQDAPGEHWVIYRLAGPARAGEGG